MKKAVKGQQAMYKSTSATVGRKSFIMKEFTPASVSSIDVQISGFPTSYSYYIANEGIDGISKKDVSAANSVSNDWMGPGKAVCTITKSGIPSALLSVKSVSLFVNGAEFPGIKYTVGSDNTITINQTTGHTTWEQKDITAKVVYTTPDGATFESKTSNTLTRHITGLPYKVSFNKNTIGWDLTKSSLSNGYLVLGDSTGENSAKCDFYTPNDTNISLTVGKADLHSTSSITIPNLKLSIGGKENTKVLAGHYKGNILFWKIEYDITYTNEKFIGSITNKENTIEMTSGTIVAGPYIHINELSVRYE